MQQNKTKLLLIIKTGALLLAAFYLGGCAVMSKSDCATANWQRIGYDIGLDGEPDMRGAWQKRAELCAGHGYAGDFDAYLSGYQRGIIDHCDTQNAVRLGARGSTRTLDYNLCPDDEYPGFAVAWQDGIKLWEFRRDAQAVRNQVDRLYQHRDRYYYQRREIRQGLQNGDLDDRQRQNLRQRLRYIDRELYQVRSDIDRLENQLRKRIRAAEEYQDILMLEYGDEWR